MTPNYATKLLAYNKHTSNPDKHPNPFSGDQKHSRNLLNVMRIQAEDEARLKLEQQQMSDARAKIAAMNHDAVSAALWALASFDPALAQLAELREHFLHVRKLDEEDPLRITLDRLVSVYVEGQCRELLNGAEITTDQANLFVEQRIIEAEEGPKPDEVAFHILACTSDPLAMELNAYALWLGSLTAHGTAPWKRFASTMADCYYKRHPLAS